MDSKIAIYRECCFPNCTKSWRISKLFSKAIAPIVLPWVRPWARVCLKWDIGFSLLRQTRSVARIWQQGGHIFKIQYWMYAATGGPNLKWGGTDFKWGGGHHWPPRWRRPCARHAHIFLLGYGLTKTHRRPRAGLRAVGCLPLRVQNVLNFPIARLQYIREVLWNFFYALEM